MVSVARLVLASRLVERRIEQIVRIEQNVRIERIVRIVRSERTTLCQLCGACFSAAVLGLCCGWTVGAAVLVVQNYRFVDAAKVGVIAAVTVVAAAMVVAAVGEDGSASVRRSFAAAPPPPVVDAVEVALFDADFLLYQSSLRTERRRRTRQTEIWERKRIFFLSHCPTCSVVTGWIERRMCWAGLTVMLIEVVAVVAAAVGAGMVEWQVVELVWRRRRRL